jgi:hypothetical protein
MPDEYALTWEQGIRHLVSQIQGGFKYNRSWAQIGVLWIE